MSAARIARLTSEVEESAVERIVDAGEESRFVGAEEKGQRSYLFRLGHSSDRLGFCQLLKHLLLAPWIVPFQVAIHERGVDAGRRNAVAADIVMQIVLCDGKGHGDDRAFAHGIGKTIGERGGTCNGSHIEDDAPAIRFEMADTRMHAVIEAFHVDAKHSIEVGFGCTFERADVGDTRIVHQNIQVLVAEIQKKFFDLLRVGYIAGVRRRLAACRKHKLRGGARRIAVEIENMDGRSTGSKSQGDSASDSTAAPGHYSDFAVQSENVFAAGLQLRIHLMDSPVRRTGNLYPPASASSVFSETELQIYAEPTNLFEEIGESAGATKNGMLCLDHRVSDDLVQVLPYAETFMNENLQNKKG